ncbi:hypothetical protein K523DRAFT_290383 [Schizophyllum commune Tattone D]|nr:hypothetical protein K523DRAFT_290383 [Schizophyllum commune Tattone D]
MPLATVTSCTRNECPNSAQLKRLDPRICLAPVEKFYQYCVANWDRLDDVDINIMVARLTARGILIPAHGWVQPLDEFEAEILEGRSAWDRMKKTINAIAEVASEALPDRFGLDNRTSQFIYVNEGYALFSDKEEKPIDNGEKRVCIDAVMRFITRSPHSTVGKRGCAKDQLIFGKNSTGVKGAVKASDAAITIHWRPRDRRDMMARNEFHALAAASFMMDNDRRRKFQFSLTIEDTQATLWHHTRSHSTIAYSFDMNEEYEELIQFVLFASFATPSQLGIDPSADRVIDADGLLQYQFDMKHEGDPFYRTYQTTTLLCEKSADERLHRRGMVVYGVRPAIKGNGLTVEMDAPPLVLRDFWQKDSVSEQDTQREIVKLMKGRAKTEEERRRIDDFFVTILAESTIAEEVTRQVHHDGEAPAWMPRVHRRVLYGELCTPLAQVKDPRLFFFALAVSCSFLRMMRCIDRIHCDISPGNIFVHPRSGKLLCDEPWHRDLRTAYTVKVADFEHTKAYCKASPEDSCIGTPPYMAVEVQAGEHLFGRENMKPSALARRPFTMNFFHDLEAVFWIAFEFAMDHVSRDILLPLKDWEELRPALLFQRQYALRLFGREKDNKYRRKLMLGDEREIKLICGMLKRSYGVDSPIPMLAGLIVSLGDAYVILENKVKGSKVGEDNFNMKIYDLMEDIFIAISKAYTGIGIDVIPLSALPDLGDPESMTEKEAAQVEKELRALADVEPKSKKREAEEEPVPTTTVPLKKRQSLAELRRRRNQK